MLRLALLTVLAFAPVAAQASEGILMVNMNYSSAELAALRQEAQRRGEQVYVVPPESMIATAEPLFKLRIGLQDQIKRLRPDWTKSQVEAMVSEYQRRGLDSDRDPQLNAALQGMIAQLRSETHALADTESKMGSMRDQINAMADQLKANGVHLDALVLSAHSDGANLSGESTLRLSSTDFDRLQTAHPEMFSEPRHVLLLGCYNMTETNRERWRGDLFPSASLVAGFGVQAPSRWRDTGVNYVKDVLRTADELDDQLARQRAPLDANLVSRAFRKLAAVANTQSVLDYCKQIVEGQPGTGKISCSEQWIAFRQQSTLVTREFLNLTQLQQDPPEDPNGGSLRTYLNLLHGTCPATENPDFTANDRKAAERFRLQMKDMVTRLIFWPNVQSNFKTYFAPQMDTVAKHLGSFGLGVKMPALDGTTGRIEFVNAYNLIDQKIHQEQDRIFQKKLQLDADSSATAYFGSRDLTRRSEALTQAADEFYNLYKPLYNLRGENSVGDVDQRDVVTTLSRGGIPFNWVESGTVLSPGAAN